jgi:hypothetical protein
MDSTYTRWVNHGGDLDVDVNENPVDMHDNDYGVAEDDNNAGDQFGEILRYLHTAEEQGNMQDGENQDGNIDANPNEKSHFLKQ